MTWLLALPLAYLLWRTLARGRIEYTHREAFTPGNIYYLALPLALASTTRNFGQIWLGPWRDDCWGGRPRSILCQGWLSTFQPEGPS